MKKIYKKRDIEDLNRVLKDEIAAARESRARQKARHDKILAKRKRIKSGKRKHSSISVRVASKPQAFAKVGKPHPEYVSGPDFYSSREWRQLRYLALKMADGKCMCCGASAADGARIHVDHIVPRYKRPDLSLSLSNLQILCDDCNIGKGAWDSTDWRKSR